MAGEKDFSSLTLKFGAFAIAVGISLSAIVFAVWQPNVEQVGIAALFAALTLWIANSIEKELIEKYNSRSDKPKN